VIPQRVIIQKAGQVVEASAKLAGFGRKDIIGQGKWETFPQNEAMRLKNCPMLGLVVNNHLIHTNSSALRIW